MPQEQLQEQESEQTLVLLAIENKIIVEAFSKDGGLDSIIEQARQEVAGFVHDLSTAAGRKKTASMAHKVSKFKMRLDGMGKDLTSESKKKIAVIDKSRKAMREALSDLKAEVRKPLTEWEEAEVRRGQIHRSNLAGIRGLALIIHPETGDKITLAEMEENLFELQLIIIGESWEEFKPEAEGAKEASMFALSAAIKETREQLAKELELEKLRQEKIEREKKEHEDKIAKEAAEKARLEAEEKAEKERVKAKKVAADKAAKIEADKQAALRREKEQKERAEKAEREKEAAEKQAKFDALNAKNARIAAEEQAKTDAKNAEKARIAAKEKAKEDAAVAAEKAKQDQIDLQKQKEADEIIIQEKLEANKKHVGKIRGEAKDSLIALGLTQDTARKLVLAVHNGEVKNISIKY